MEQEGIGTFAHQFIKNLRVTSSTQRCGNQRLRFTTGEQRRTVSTRQHASTHIQTTDHIFFTTVDTRFACQYAATNNVFLDRVQNFTQFVFSKQRRDGFRFDDINLRITLLFVGDAVSIAQASFSQCSNARV